ncbi:MAG: hypothetical protein A2902_05260 [Elusimicrobia bacterium RIFCSPLOWO2_01_FULL_64_13]|nr:MAG: hypothetical protein A2902_05260 [Elusimicrobia bacterium RIFCSPLOWO2_01_FULL_64_13]
MNPRGWPVFFLSLCLGGCAGFEVQPGPGEAGLPASAGSVPFQSYESLHFVVRARDYSLARDVAESSEEIYRKVMFDTNLLSFKPRESYRVTIYEDRDQYRDLTGNPDWSGGVTTTLLLGRGIPGEREEKARTSIATYEEVLTPRLMAHEIVHLVFNEFMEFADARIAERVRWLNEGLATFEELEYCSESERSEFFRMTQPLLRKHAQPLPRVMSANPFLESASALGSYSAGGRSVLYTNIDVWYWQSRSLVEFLILDHGRYNFYLFMEALKRGRPVEDALRDAYPGKWGGLGDLESEWRGSAALRRDG